MGLLYMFNLLLYRFVVGMVRMEFQQCLETSEGFREIAGREVSDTEIVQGLRMVRLNLKRVLVQLHRPDGVSGVQIRRPQISSNVHIIRYQEKGLFIPLNGPVKTAHIVVGISQSHSDLAILGIGFCLSLKFLQLLQDLSRRMVLRHLGGSLGRGDTLLLAHSGRSLNKNLRDKESKDESDQDSHHGGDRLSVLHRKAVWYHTDAQIGCGSLPQR